MLVNTRLFLGAALLVAACSANAATQTKVGFDASRSDRVAAEQSRHRQLLLNRASQGEAKSGNSVTSAIPGLPRVNTLTPYPPSCLADPLPDQTSGPTYGQNVSLAAFNSGTGLVDSTEIVNITIWRVACSTPVGSTFHSATLMRINRNSSSTAVYPLIPAIRIAQGSTGFGNSDAEYLASLARLAIEPNTWISDTYTGTPIIYDTTFVLENYDSTLASVFDFSQPFTIRFDNQFNSNNLFYIDVPVYSPTAQTYPAAFQNLPISGFMSTNWYDPTADGEGIALQIIERGGDTQNLVVSFTWTAYDPSGLPFWLSGQAEIPRGATSATATMFYRTGGGLGGDSGAASSPITWGSATVSFPDCNNMTLTYASSNAGLPVGIPTGSGTRNWQRIANLNGLACQ